MHGVIKSKSSSHLLSLDALVAAVLLTILGLTSSFFIQALVDFIFVLGRKPALNWLGLGMLLVTLARAGFLGLRSYLLAHLSRGSMQRRCLAIIAICWDCRSLSFPFARPAKWAHA